MPSVLKTSSGNRLVDCGVISVQKKFHKSRQQEWSTFRETGTRMRRLNIGMQIHERVGYHRRDKKLTRNWGNRKTERAHDRWKHLIVHQPRRRWKRCPGIQWIRTTGETASGTVGRGTTARTRRIAQTITHDGLP